MQNKTAEKGFSLLGVLALAIIVTFAAFAALQLFRHESKSLISSLKRDRLEACLDSGLDKALFQLNSNPTSWTSTASTDYFSSLTATTTAFTDMDGYQYWVKVLAGSRVQPTGVTITGVVAVTNANTLNDTTANNLTNTGDLTFNRSILVLAKDIKTGLTLTAMAIVHRSAVSPVIPIGGIYTNGAAGLGGSNGASFNSCGGSLTSTGCAGSVIGGAGGTGGVAGGGANCLPQTTPVAAVPYPPVTIPPGTIPWPFGPNPNTLVTQSYTAPNGNNNYSYNMTGNMKVQVGAVDLNNDNFYITTNGFKLEIYCTSTFGATGNPGWYMDDPTAPGTITGGHPSLCWVYVVGSGAVKLGGTGNYELVMVAPESTVTVNGNGGIYGAVVANVFNKTGASGIFRFDECILKQYRANTYARPPIISVSWAQF